MNFTCDRKIFSEKLMNLQRTVSSKAVLPVLEGILIKAYNGKITLCSYDLEIGTTTEMDAEIKEEGEIVLKAKLLCDVINKLPNETVHISTNNTLVTNIVCGKVKYKLSGVSSVEFPDLPTFEEKTHINIKASMLQDMIRKVKFAVSDNNQTPVYTGALFDIKNKYLNIVALDGFRMAIRKEPIDEESDMQFVVPGKALNELLRFNITDEEDIQLIVGQRHITFKINDYYLVSRLLDGVFLNYEKTIPTEITTELKINKNSIMSSIERMYILNMDKLASPITCVLSNDEIKMSSVTSVGSADESILVPIKGEELTIGFNNKYLLDALRNCDTDEIKMEFSSATRPLKITPVEGDSFLFIVLPMRLTQ